LRRVCIKHSPISSLFGIQYESQSNLIRPKSLLIIFLSILSISLLFDTLRAAISQFISFDDYNVFGPTENKDNIFINAIGYFKGIFYGNGAQICILLSPNFSSFAIGEGERQNYKFITGMKAELVNREADEDLAVLQNSYQLDFDPKSRVVSDDEEFY